jgi:hypothetical protein
MCSLMLNVMPDAFAAGKGGGSKGTAHAGQMSAPSNANSSAGSRRDRRGQPQPTVNPPPQGVRPIRGIQVRCDGHKCGPYNPFKEYPNRRAQVRDHR